MADCSEIAPLLGIFEDGELEPHEMQEVARHLAHCSNCEIVLHEYTALGRHLRAVVVSPPLENFAHAVQHRLDEVHIPVRARIEHYLESLGERWTTALMLTSAALALGAWALLFAPYARQHFEQQQNADQIANAEPEARSFGHSEPAPPLGAAFAESGPQTVISRLEANSPAVAVWSEPETRTTVIWVPDESSTNE